MAAVAVEASTLLEAPAEPRKCSNFIPSCFTASLLCSISWAFLAWSVNACSTGNHGVCLIVPLPFSAALFFTWLTLTAAKVTWGVLDIPLILYVTSVPFGLIVAFAIVCPALMSKEMVKTLSGIISLGVLAELYLILNLRTTHVWLGCAALFVSLQTYTPLSLVNRLAKCQLSLAVFACGFMPYLRDARLALMLAHLLHAVVISQESDSSPTQLATYAIFVVLGTYLFALYERRRRVLPQALRNCRFARLGHLRSMLANGELISRYQDLPPEAFGDVGKAEHLLITSHRWLDRYTCDVATDACPVGVRLESMVRRLGYSFPVTLMDAKARGWISFPKALFNGCKCSGSDIILFFDFMGLPQIGKDASGELIPRTAQETELFFEALPAMGALYTMYQVIVLPEVVPGVHPYFSSGWCFSELCAAMLTKKLAEYSPEVIEEYMQELRSAHDSSVDPACVVELTTGTLTSDLLVKFEHMVTADLAQKKFFCEDDRATVAGIVQGFTLKRLLRDAVDLQDVSEVHNLLSQLKQQGLQGTLEHAVDESLDTLLHVATRYPSVEIVDALIDAGSNPNARNLAGDTPTEYWMFPRLFGASWKVRQAGTVHAESASYSPLPLTKH